MCVYRVLMVILLAAVIVTVSGCIEFGAVPDKPPTQGPTASPTAANTATPKAQVPDTQVRITLKNVSADQTPGVQETENLVLTLQNTGATRITDLYFTYASEDPVAAEILSSGSVPVGSLDAGGQTDVIVSVPRYSYLRTMTFSVTVYWGDDPGHVNDKTRPWVISLVTDQFWEK